MDDNNNNDAAAVEDDRTFVETNIERIKSENPKERLFSITFDNFEELPSAKGQMALSSTFSCFGNQWRIKLHPGGYSESLTGMVAVFLERCSGDRKLAIKYSIGFNGDEERMIRLGKSVFDGSVSWGWANFYSRSEIIGDDEEGGFLVNGALTLYVGIQLDEFIPKNPASSFMLKLFNDENSADIVFEICEQHKSDSESDRKRAKTSTEKLYHAHRFILQHYSAELSALCATSDGMTPIIITDVKPEVFRHLLYYVYGGEISDEDFAVHEKDFINAADKYEVTNLKLEAEVWYVNNTEITIDNVIDNLLYADAMNCALLKESVMDFIVESKEEVMQRVSFQDVPGDVCKDLLAAVSRHYEKDSPGDDGEGETEVEKTYSKMRIRDLRQKLDEKGLGLDIDGSREALIANLKEHS
ncbi:BTB/POZ and MATH domain-containing protein [Skeletonema marinoi]|uniref:BTB/POZ and MATH domain-containing protein n=1 Tax=Skeletonema marinoi TaxID=267567 RepID=A0AAD9D608_9STRA|nr:BTB/POZ and MATH domain-containing protein [Skeletonema marinoi]